MTTMDSDSESQDSDDGRRFRFEATRKDNAQAEAKIKTESSRQTSKHESHHEDTEYKDGKDRSRRENSRKEYRTSKDWDTDNKDLRHATKYSKHTHESRSSRYEDSHRDTRDSSLISKNSSTLVSKHKTRDSKHHKNRDRSEHRKHRSQERSHSRNEDDRPSFDKHKNKSHEKYKRHSRDRSRERNYQSHKLKSSDYNRSRGEYERHNSYRKALAKEDESQQAKEYSAFRNVEQGRNDSELSSKKYLSTDNQDCKNLDLSEFDVLSETDDNLSDDLDVGSQSSVHHKTKVKKRNFNDDRENSVKKQATESEEHLEEYEKVNARRNDPSCGSSNNNPSAISDSLLGTALSITSALTEDRMNDDSKRFKRESKEEVVSFSNTEESSVSMEETSLHLDSYDSSKEAPRSEEETEYELLSSSVGTTDSIYGPALPPTLTANSFDARDKEKSPCLPDAQAENVTNMKEAKAFIGPCLPETNVEKETLQVTYDTADRQETMEDSEADVDLAFGPALPPHLVQGRSSESAGKVIGPSLPGTINLNTRSEARCTDSEDEDGIGPLPANHPALQNSYVYKQLEQRAQKLMEERTAEDNNLLNQREEWMTELPPAQASNLGLGPRKFRLKAGPDMSDRSSWTDTPAQKAEKLKQRINAEEHKCKPKTQDDVVAKESCETKSGKSKAREKSLLEIHQSKLRKKKKKEEKEAKLTGQTVRRPFDRDIDLKANQFDQAQKHIILRKAQLLDERFSRGKI